MIKRNLGFDGRIFLTEAEWTTYLRRMPVRYIKQSKDSVCAVCGGGPSPEKPFENAHIIGFNLGLVNLALTPDFLDSRDNITTTHRGMCNHRAERTLEESMYALKEAGVTSLPTFLPEDILELWETTHPASNFRAIKRGAEAPLS